MKTTIRIAFTLTALAAIGSAAFAQGTSTQTPTSTTTPTQTTQTAEQKAKLDAEKKAELDRALKEVEQARKQVAQAQKQAQQDVEKDIAKVQDALRQAQQQMQLYEKGTAALDRERYEKALEAFAAAAALKGQKADSALYWKAFSEYKVQAMQAALESLKEIQKNFPDSRWLEQALALEFEVKEKMGTPVSPAATPDEELKLLALNSLLHTDAEQALPMLEKMINGQQSLQLKRRALFVLSQSPSPKAREVLASVARNSSDPNLQLEALRYLRMLGGPENKKLLADIYAGSKEEDVKVHVLDALFTQGDATTLVEMARKETDPAMRKRIVERLSRMKSKEATDYMLEIINK